MSLDKQRILSELGSVMTQLQGADCGCMGRLFENSNPNGMSQPTGAPLPTCGGCRRGCCNGHGYGVYNQGGSAGDPYSSMQACAPPCGTRGRCNPSKLYADTYSYLNENMMQPTVREVYDDLKSITPANTVMNNQTLAQQMGLSGQQPMGSGPGMMSGRRNGMAGNQGMNNTGMSNNMPIPGMGPGIASMMMKGNNDSKHMSGHTGSGGQLSEPMIIDAPGSPHGKVGVQPLSIPQGRYKHGDNPANMMQAPQAAQYMSSNVAPRLQSQNPGFNPSGQYSSPRPGFGGAGSKFNDMFPGAMKNFGDDLGFDPMAIAIQMNPNNAKRAAMDTMQKMMSNPDAEKSLDKLGGNVFQPMIDKAKALADSKKSDLNSNISENKENVPVGGKQAPEQVNTANTDSVLSTPQEQNTPTSLQDYTSSPSTQKSYTNKINPALPVDTTNTLPSADKVYQYNTLGQPIELLPAEMYHMPAESLPQTLSPSPVSMKQLLSQNTTKSAYSNVKASVSKTSIMDVNKTASKSKLQHLYNQYRNSPSDNQQTLPAPMQKMAHSEGRLASAPLKDIPESAAIEKFGGDTLANHKMEAKIENVVDQIGDVPQSKANVAKLQSSTAIRKGRNGLQDVVFTSYPTTAAWSFHGRSDSVPYSSKFFQRS